MGASNVELLTRQEATPGQAEAGLDENDALVQLRDDQQPAIEAQKVDLRRLNPTSTKVPDAIGSMQIRQTVPYVLVGPGDLVAVPAAAPLLESAMLARLVAKKISIGTITGGDIRAGQTITGGTSGATGKVIRTARDGDTDLYYSVVSGVFQDLETITEDDNGANCAASSDPVDQGHSWWPADWNPTAAPAGHHLTLALNYDGQQFLGRGMLSDLAISLQANEVGGVVQQFLGAYVSETDAALLGITSYPEELVPIPIFGGSGTVFDTFQPTGIDGVEINWPINPTLVADANATESFGYRFTQYNRRGAEPTIQLGVDQVSKATFDLLLKLSSADPVYFETTLGETEGSQWTFVCPRLQLEGADPSRGEPDRSTRSVNGSMKGWGDNDEFCIWQH